MRAVLEPAVSTTLGRLRAHLSEKKVDTLSYRSVRSASKQRPAVFYRRLRAALTHACTIIPRAVPSNRSLVILWLNLQMLLLIP